MNSLRAVAPVARVATSSKVLQKNDVIDGLLPSCSTCSSSKKEMRTIFVGEFYNYSFISFPGATTQDMEYFLKPLMNREPNHIVLHVGTNNLGEQEPQEIAEKIQILAKQITELGIGSSVSSIITGRDGLSEKASKVNVILKKNLPSKIELIDHSSITEGHLNGSGLHLNQRWGTGLQFDKAY